MCVFLDACVQRKPTLIVVHGRVRHKRNQERDRGLLLVLDTRLASSTSSRAGSSRGCVQLFAWRIVDTLVSGNVKLC